MKLFSWGGCVIVAALLLLFGAIPAHASPLLDPVDAAELAQSLAEATDEQGVCYGWSINVDGSPEVGSNLGPDVPLNNGGSCEKFAILSGTIDYTCDTCEAEDSGSLSLQTNLPITIDELKDLTGVNNLHANNKDDIGLVNLTEGLPLLVAAKGAAEPVIEDDDAAQTIPVTDKPDDGSAVPDKVRSHWMLLALAAIMLGGAAYLLYLETSINYHRRF